MTLAMLFDLFIFYCLGHLIRDPKGIVQSSCDWEEMFASGGYPDLGVSDPRSLADSPARRVGILDERRYTGMKLDEWSNIYSG
jgi:hypothetical protein